MTDINQHRDDEWNLSARLPDVDPPKELAMRVKNSLEQRGLVLPDQSLQATTRTPAARTHGKQRLAFAFAAGLALFLGGMAFGRITTGSAPDSTTTSAAQPRFALLLYGAPTNDPGAVHDARFQEYSTWARNLPQGGHFMNGEELLGTVAVVGAARITMDTAAVEPVQGFFVISAPSQEAAVAIARECPHVRHGGRVEVRLVGG